MWDRCVKHVTNLTFFLLSICKERTSMAPTQRSSRSKWKKGVLLCTFLVMHILVTYISAYFGYRHICTFCLQTFLHILVRAPFFGAQKACENDYFSRECTVTRIVSWPHDFRCSIVCGVPPLEKRETGEQKRGRPENKYTFYFGSSFC